MHELFAQVLGQSDLSKAGDLFSLNDHDIENDLSEVLYKIKDIASSTDYVHSDNNQSVVEICINRVTSAIRETGSIEKHAGAMVVLLASCLKHDLRPSGKDEDPPHAKIASDILSCVFLNYSKKAVMELAMPVAVRFLKQGNRELSRNMSSYLSLAALENSALLALQIYPILDSIVNHKNKMLARVLLQIYAENKDPIHEQVDQLVGVLPDCDSTERNSLLQLFLQVAKDRPRILEPSLLQLCRYLSSSSTSSLVLQIFVDMAAANPDPFLNHMTQLKTTAEAQPTTLSLVVRVLGAIGKIDKAHGKDVVGWLVSQLCNCDNQTLPLLLKEIKHIAESFPSVLPEHIDSISKYSQSGSISAQIVIEQLKELSQKSASMPERKTVASQTEGLVTVIGNVQNVPVKPNHTQGTASPPVAGLPNSKNASTSTRDINYPQSLSVALVPLPVATSVQHTPSSVLLSSSISTVGTTVAAGSSTVLHHATPVTPPSGNMARQASGSQSYVAQALAAIQQSLADQQAMQHSPHSPPPGSMVHPPQPRMGMHPITPPPHMLNAPVVMSGSSYVVAPIAPATQTGLVASTHPAQQHQAGVHPPHPLHPQTHARPVHTQSHTLPMMGHQASHHPPLPLLTTTHPAIPPPHLTNIYTPPPHNSSHSIHTPPHPGANPHAHLPPTSGPVTPQPPVTVPSSVSPAHPSVGHPPSTVSAVATITRTTFARARLNQEDRRSLPTSTASYVGQPHAIPFRDAVLQFCEKHLDKIKAYINNVTARLPIPIKASWDEWKHKRRCKLYFICFGQGDQCLYDNSFFTFRTKAARIWIHLMFLVIQARSDQAVSQQDPSVGNLKACWDALKMDQGNSFVRLVTSTFPSSRDQDVLLHELHNVRYFDVFEFNAMQKHWACFLCNHPEKVTGLMQDGSPVIEGQLKEKKGKWKIFKRWKTRYFTLSGTAITYRKKDSRKATLPVNKIRSVKAVRRGMRDIPKAFEIFTLDQTYVFKAKDGKKAEQWLQCLQIAMAHTQRRETVTEFDVQSWAIAPPPGSNNRHSGSVASTRNGTRKTRAKLPLEQLASSNNSSSRESTLTRSKGRDSQTKL